MMNLEMAKRCDSAKPFSISGYKSPAEVSGMMYCCSLLKKGQSGSGAMAKSTAPSLSPSGGTPAKSGIGGSASPGSGSAPSGAAGKSSGGLLSSTSKNTPFLMRWSPSRSSYATIPHFEPFAIGDGSAGDRLGASL